MQVTRLRVGDLRKLASVEIMPGPGINLLVGDNGAGKTSVLEALHLMAYGRSFRGRVRDGLVRTGAGALEIYIEWTERGGERARRAGLRHAGSKWEGRLDGEAVSQLGDLCAALAVVTFEPGSHALVGGSAEPRRRFMDWGLFHVEPAFLPAWRRYARALRQRNALLKRDAGADELEIWDRELVAAGEPITALRQAYIESLEPVVAATAATIAPGLGAATMQFLPGWRQEAVPLGDALLLARERDRFLGHTSVGHHRCDWRIAFSAVGDGEALSRGQAKLAALACLLGQAGDLATRVGEWPVVALDDLASELDAGHRRRLLGFLGATPAQVFITGTDTPETIPDIPGRQGAVLFHVEQGRVTAA